MRLQGISNAGMKRVAKHAQVEERDITKVLEAQAVTMDYIVDALYTLREADYDLFSQFGAAKFHAAMNAISELMENPEKIFSELW